MNWQEIIPPFIGSSGIIGILAFLAYKLHVDAVDAHKQRADDWHAQADDWREAHARATERADERDKQLSHILGAVREATHHHTESQP